MLRALLPVGLLILLWKTPIVEGLGLEDVKNGLILLKDIISTFFFQYKEERQNQMGKIDSLMNSFTLAIRKALPPEKPQPPIEDFLPMGTYMCTNHGFTKNMKTLRKIGKIHYLWHSDGSMDLTLFYHIEEFQTRYGVFYFETPVYSKTGNITFTYGKNKIAIQLYIPHLGKALMNIAKEPCLVYVKGFDFAELGVEGVEVQSEGLSQGKWTSDKLMQILAVNAKPLVDTMEREVLYEMYETLPIKPVCNHPNLDLQAKELKADTGTRIYSDKFKKHCGEKWVPKSSVNKGGKEPGVMAWLKNKVF